MLAPMRTGQVATQAGVNTQTLRYYERRGLLREPPRRDSGYRVYPADAVRIVRFIKHVQELGFTLAEIETLLHLAAGGPESCEAVQAMATQKIGDLERRLASLRHMRSSLQRLVATCSRPRDQRDCPLLRAIDADDGCICAVKDGADA